MSFHPCVIGINDAKLYKAIDDIRGISTCRFTQKIAGLRSGDAVQHIECAIDDGIGILDELLGRCGQGNCVYSSLASHWTDPQNT